MFLWYHLETYGGYENKYKSMHFRASPPSENTARKRAEMHRALALAGLGSEVNPTEVSFCEDIVTHARTYFETNND